MLYNMPLLERRIEFHTLVITSRQQLKMLYNDLNLLLEQFNLKFVVTATREEEEEDGMSEEEMSDDSSRCKRSRLAPSMDLSTSTPATSDK